MCLFFTGLVFAYLFIIYALFMLSFYSNVLCIYLENIVFSFILFYFASIYNVFVYSVFVILILIFDLPLGSTDS